MRPYPEELITIALELLAFSFELLPSHHPLEESGQRHPVSKYIRQYNRQLKNQFKRALPAPPYDIIHRQQLLVRRSPLLTVPLATEVQVLGGAGQDQLSSPSLKLRWPGDWPGNFAFAWVLRLSSAALTYPLTLGTSAKSKPSSFKPRSRTTLQTSSYPTYAEPW